MIVLLIATNRPGSNSAKVAAHVVDLYEAKAAPLHVLDLQLLPAEIFSSASYAEKPATFAPFQEAIAQAEGVLVVMPEYNGGFPGVFKYFIDMLKFPESFAGKPFAFIGVSAGAGGAGRAIEQFETLVTYLHGVNCPGHIMIPAIYSQLDEAGRLKSPEMVGRLEKQADAFLKFIKSVGKS